MRSAAAEGTTPPIDLASYVAANRPALLRAAVGITRDHHDAPAARLEVLVGDGPEPRTGGTTSSHTSSATGEEVWEAVLALPPRQRATVVLRYYEGLGEAEIAGVLGISRGTVKSNAARGLAALRRALTTHDEPRGMTA